MTTKTDGRKPGAEGRVVHVMRGAHDLYVGRKNARAGLPGSDWANPFHIGRDGDRRTVLARFEEELRHGSLSHLLPRLREIEGLTLACWCAPKGGVGPHDPLVCHAQILLRLAAERSVRYRVVRESNPTFDANVVERLVVAEGLSRSASDHRIRELDEEARASGALAVHVAESESGPGGMKEAVGDLWEMPADLRVITTNPAINRKNQAVMGRGCALEAKRRIPGLEYRFAGLLREHGNRVMRLARYRGADLASFPVKHHWKDEADPDLVHSSALQLAALADKFGYECVVLPRPGCGNGRLSWEGIRPILAEILDDRFTVVTFPQAIHTPQAYPRGEGRR